MVISGGLTCVKESITFRHPWYCAINRATDVEALYSDRYGLAGSCTWNVPGCWAFRLLCRSIPHGGDHGRSWTWDAGRRGGLGRGWTDFDAVHKSVVTLLNRRRASRAGVVHSSRRIASAVTFVSTSGAAARPSAHFLFPGLKHRAVRVVRGELWVEKEMTL